MKQLMIFLAGLAVGVAIMYFSCSSGRLCGQRYADNDDATMIGNLPPDQGIIIDTLAFNNLLDAFKLRNPQEQNYNGTWGGKIGVAALRVLLDSIPAGDMSHIDYRFGMQPMAAGGPNKTFLMFYKKARPVGGNKKSIFLTSPDTDRSFCPTVCNLDN